MHTDLSKCITKNIRHTVAEGFLTTFSTLRVPISKCELQWFTTFNWTQL